MNQLELGIALKKWSSRSGRSKLVPLSQLCSKRTKSALVLNSKDGYAYLPFLWLPYPPRWPTNQTWIRIEIGHIFRSCDCYSPCFKLQRLATAQYVWGRKTYILKTMVSVRKKWDWKAKGGEWENKVRECRAQESRTRLSQLSPI